MIAKKAPARADARSSFCTLANYISKPETQVRVQNCGVDDPHAAIKIVEATQQLNTRAKSDKTYHLVVSFRAGEHPTDAECHLIEDEFCRALGFEDHQRLSAVHRDTEHDHVHVAINKIHPRTLNIREPHNDFFIIDELCSRLEKELGLQVDNRIADKLHLRDQVKPLNAKVASIEAHSGLKAFQTWVADNLTEKLPSVVKEASSWADLHQALSDVGVQLRPRGAGLVLGDLQERGWMKASGACPALSMPALVKRLGDFQASKAQGRNDRPVTYQPKPKHKTEKLWDRFQREKNAAVEARKLGFARIRAGRDMAYAQLAARKAELRARVSADRVLTKLQKRRLYERAVQMRRIESLKIKAEFDRKAQRLRSMNPLFSWHEFLVENAIGGDPQALNVLRRRAGPMPAAVNTITGDSDDSLLRNAKPTLSKTGVATYRFEDGSTVVDHGCRLDVDLKSEASAAQVLAIARHKFGEVLSAQGDAAFERVIANAAATTDLLFDNAKIERRRAVVAQFGSKDAPRRPSSEEVNNWIDSRNVTRARVKNMKQHTLLDVESQKGVTTLAGLREIQPNRYVALFEKKGEPDTMFVLGISERQANRYRHVPLGRTFTVRRDGHLTEVDRSR